MLLSPSDVQMFLPSKLFHSPQPALNLTHSEVQDDGVLQRLFHLVVYGTGVVKLLNSI